jgi:hypothetical protein
MAIASLAALSAAPAAPIRAASLDAFVRAYPDELASHDETNIIWHDATRQTTRQELRQEIAQRFDSRPP